VYAITLSIQPRTFPYHEYPDDNFELG